MPIEVLAIALAIATLTSGFHSAVQLVSNAKRRRAERRASGMRLAELERLEQSLLAAKASVANAYEGPYRRFGQQFKVGDDLARYILFALAARQDALLRRLQTLDFDTTNIQPLIDSIEGTKLAATQCLAELATRTERPTPPLQVSLHDQANLLMDYQRLCHSAVLYRTKQATHAQLATISSSRGESSCHRCGATMFHSKLPIPGADAQSCVLINISGLFRAHCHGGEGLTCIWKMRVPACYGVFPDEKALLRHMLSAHVRDDGTGMNVRVDWSADVRRGNLEKCGFMVRINGVKMRNQGGDLLVSLPRGRSVAGLPSVRVTAPSVVSEEEGGELPPPPPYEEVSPMASSVTLDSSSSGFGEMTQSGQTNGVGSASRVSHRPPSGQGNASAAGSRTSHRPPSGPIFEAASQEVFEMFG